MLKTIKGLLLGNQAEAKTVPEASSQACPTGYFIPLSSGQLLNTAARKQCLQQLWESSALPKDLYEQFYLQPLEKLIAMMQALPASQQGEYAGENGLAEVTLQTTTFAVRLAKGHMLPPGAAPEEQSAQNILWNAVIFYAALCRYLPVLDQIEGELQSGQPWLPGLTIPNEPYRFRFKATPSEPTLTTSQCALIGARLVPSEAIAWLSTLPVAAQALMLITSRQPSPLPVIDEIVQEAVQQARGGSLLQALPAASMGIVAPAPQSLQTGTTEPLTPVMDLQSAAPAVEVPPPENVPTATVAEFNPPPVADVVLVSALEDPVDDNQVTNRVVAPEAPAGNSIEDMKTLLSLMAVTIPAPGVQETQEESRPPQVEHLLPEDNQPLEQVMPTVMEAPIDIPEQTAEQQIKPVSSKKQVEAVVTSEGETDARVEDIVENPADVFWQWLRDGLNTGEIPINKEGSRAHIVSGFVFLCVPEIFHLYIKEAGLERNARNSIQKAFEKLNKHRNRKGQRFFIGHLYQNPTGVGSYRRINGYLVKANSLYGTSVPGDSRFLVIP